MNTEFLQVLLDTFEGEDDEIERRKQVVYTYM